MATMRKYQPTEEFVLDPRPPLPASATQGQQWRFRRNLVIFLAARQGMSQRVIADVFDLPRSRIAEIIREFDEYCRNNKVNDDLD